MNEFLSPVLLIRKTLGSSSVDRISRSQIYVVGMLVSFDVRSKEHSLITIIILVTKKGYDINKIPSGA